MGTVLAATVASRTCEIPEQYGGGAGHQQTAAAVLKRYTLHTGLAQQDIRHRLPDTTRNVVEDGS